MCKALNSMIAFITPFMDELIGPSFKLMLLDKCKMVVKRSYTPKNNKR
jgi:hypothetical protein